MRKNTAIMYSINGGELRTVHLDAVSMDAAWASAKGIMGRRDVLHASDFLEVHYMAPGGAPVRIRTHGVEPKRCENAAAAPSPAPAPPAPPAPAPPPPPTKEPEKERPLSSLITAVLSVKRPTNPHKRVLLAKQQ